MQHAQAVALSGLAKGIWVRSENYETLPFVFGHCHRLVFGSLFRTSPTTACGNVPGAGFGTPTIVEQRHKFGRAVLRDLT